MKKFDFYTCEGQISIFDYMQQDKEPETAKPVIKTNESVTKTEEIVTKIEESVSEPIAAVEPKKCCNTTPWLEKSKCVQWDASKPRRYMMAYICPKCGKVAVDNTGWPITGHGTYEEEQEWFNLYGIKYDDYKKPIIERANEEYRKKIGLS